ncbi:MAG: FAD-dependent oxidoreductase, partial [Phycisphaerae bacterium]|nr:FAD-dependent oxidoreductase [Phycisphaerae bacterium]
PVKVGGRGALIFKMGLSFYDFITRKRRQTPRHYFQSKAKSLEEIPGLREDIACTATYWDAWVSQIERLCVEMVQEACEENSDCLAINYVAARKEGKSSVVLGDLESGEEVVIRPKLVVNATGAWVDMANKTLGVASKFMGGTKGSHLVIDNQGLYDALGDRMIYYEHSDGRICIAFRFMDKVIMGSTDISVDDPDDAQCEDSEIDYMMTTLKGVFPGIALSKDDIVFTFCGVRPLAASGLDFTSRASRAHRIEVSEPDDQRDFKIYSMIGGKLTTFGAFSEQVAKVVVAQLGKGSSISMAERPYLGARDYPADDAAKESWIARVAKANGLEPTRVADLLARYGTSGEEIASEKDASLRAPLAALPEYTVGEIKTIVENECIGHLSDLVRRRSVIAMLGGATEAVLSELADIAGEVLDWDTARKEKEVRMAIAEVRGRK